MNGPGEAKGADVALCGGDGEFLLYLHGQPVRKVAPAEAVAAVLATLQYGEPPSWRLNKIVSG